MELTEREQAIWDNGYKRGLESNRLRRDLDDAVETLKKVRPGLVTDYSLDLLVDDCLKRLGKETP